MKTRDGWRTITSALAVLTVVGVVANNPSVTATDDDATPVVVGLNNPRGLADGPLGLLVYAEIDGTFRACSASHAEADARSSSLPVSSFFQGGVAVAGRTVYVTSPVFGPGSISRID